MVVLLSQSGIARGLRIRLPFSRSSIDASFFAFDLESNAFEIEQVCEDAMRSHHIADLRAT
jgi:hypothetical protein